VQGIPLCLPAVPFGVALARFDIQLGLKVQRADQWIRVEEQLEQRVEQPTGKAKGATV
jgi:hypothetical protein